MPSLNEGQKALLDKYVREGINDYWNPTNGNPNPQHYMQSILSRHPALRPAVGHIVQQLWHASMGAYGRAVIDEAKAEIKDRNRKLMIALRSAKTRAAEIADNPTSSEIEKWIGSPFWQKHFRSLTLRQSVDRNYPFWYREHNRLLSIYELGGMSEHDLYHQYAYLISSTNDFPNSMHAPFGYVPYMRNAGEINEFNTDYYANGNIYGGSGYQANSNW